MINPKIRYTITKTSDGYSGYSYYKVEYYLDADESVTFQNETLILEKRDVDGSTTEDSLPLESASIVSYNGNSAVGQRYQGFAVNVSDESLAVGGTYYSIDSVVGTYDNNSSSSSSDPVVTPPSSDT